MATLRGKAVDRPAFNFYEITGLESTDPGNPFNVYSDPSWKPLLELAAAKTDRIVMHSAAFKKSGAAGWKPMPELEGRTDRTIDAEGNEITVTTLAAGKRTLTQRTKRSPDINTTWVTEHLVKDVADFKAWLELPDDTRPLGEVEAQAVLDLEARAGDSGIVMLDTSDPLCGVAPLFDMAEYTIVAMTEPELFHRALQRVARRLYPRIEAVARALPGRLWRIYGPEYASPPYLPPALFKQYATDYVKPIVDIIHRYGGYARIHSHGRLKDILDHICATGCDGLDPIEPPGQGDVTLAYVRERYGRQLILFGNIEASDIENLPTPQFEAKIRQALKEGPGGRGFVLQPSSAPYGRKLPPLAMANYEAWVRCVERG
ncbi:MAG: uroporphyrinogen decarboxylase family protein [Kiritimatiellae bacterium]|nr:uroporphyrinogen decarboxylase family protein [Kiritimatiellia bacterium]